MSYGRYAPTPLDADGRRADRVVVAFKGQLKEAGTFKFPVRVLDLSISGFRFESSSKLHPGARVWLTVPGLAPLEAEVKWREGFLYGAAFAASLHPAVLDHIAKHAESMA
jgi:PilZ domain